MMTEFRMRKNSKSWKVMRMKVNMWLRFLSLFSSVDTQFLSRICEKILPRIHHQIQKLTVEQDSMQQILHAANYPQLYSLDWREGDMKKKENRFVCLWQGQRSKVILIEILNCENMSLRNNHSSTYGVWSIACVGTDEYQLINDVRNWWGLVFSLERRCFFTKWSFHHGMWSTARVGTDEYQLITDLERTFEGKHHLTNLYSLQKIW
jgi:hypothetical protein